MNTDPIESETEGRRTLLKAIAGGAGYLAVRVALPAAWSAPIVAAMPLPAHAATSCDLEAPKTGSSLDTSATVTTNDAVPGKVFFTLPADVVTNRTPVVVCRLSDQRTSVNTTLYPSADAALSGKIPYALPAGSHRLQLRWADKHSEWKTVVVK